MTTWLATALVGIGSIGCGPDWSMEIDSNTDWHGTYATRTNNQWTYSRIRGSGKRTIDVSDDQRVCFAFRQDASGYLRIKLKDEGGGPFGLMADKDREAQTNVAGGIIDACSQGDLPESWIDQLRMQDRDVECCPGVGAELEPGESIHETDVSGARRR